MSPALAPLKTSPARMLIVRNSGPNPHSLAPGRRLFLLRPRTGKTHQLRVAMKSLGAPILGDALYGGRAAPRLMLHAQSLALRHPHSDEWLQWQLAAPF